MLSGPPPEDAVAALPAEARRLFAAACAEALFDRYRAFAGLTGRGDPVGLRAALDLAWAPDGGDLSAAAALADRLVPEEDDAWTDASAGAQCAAAAVHYALLCAADGQAQWAVAAADQEHQLADQDVLDEDDGDAYTEELEAAVLADPRVQSVLERQAARLALLSGGSGPDVVARLRALG